MPKVSVICIVYNAAPFIERCARSLFEQTLEDIEYIFVDDCTPDNSFEILQKVLSDYPKRVDQVRILKLDRNSRQAAARTAGMKVATGEYQIHCDSDDWVEPYAYELLYKKAVETGSDLVGCRAFVHKVANTSTAEKFFEGNPADCLFEEQYGGSLWAKLVDTKLIQDNEIYPYEGINNGEDLNVSVRIYLKARKMAFVDRKLYHYNRDNVSSITSQSGMKQLCEYAIPNIEKIAAYIDKTADPRRTDFIDRLKFSVKNSFLEVSGLTFKDIQFLRRLWPESHKVIPRHMGLKKYKRTLMPFLMKTDLALWIFYHLLSLKNKIVKMTNISRNTQY